MPSKPRSKSKQNKKPSRPSAPVSSVQRWRDRLVVAAWIVLPLAAILALVIFSAKAQWNHSIDERLAAWKQEYHLTDNTVTHLREIELGFHGSGNPFTSPIPHNTVEGAVHHEQMAALMDPEAGKQFLSDMQRGRWKD